MRSEIKLILLALSVLVIFMVCHNASTAKQILNKVTEEIPGLKNQLQTEQQLNTNLIAEIDGMAMQIAAAESALELVCIKAKWPCFMWNDSAPMCAKTSEDECHIDDNGDLPGFIDWIHIEDVPELAPYRANPNL